MYADVHLVSLIFLSRFKIGMQGLNFNFLGVRRMDARAFKFMLLSNTEFQKEELYEFSSFG